VSLPCILLLNHHLYWCNFIIILFLIGKQFPAFFDEPFSSINSNKWWFFYACAIVVVFILAVISSNIAEGLSGANNRFPVN